MGRNGEVVGNVDAIVHHLCLEILIEKLKVDTLLEGFVRGRIEDVIDDLVEHGFLVDIAVTHNLLHGLARLCLGVLICMKNHGLRSL